MKRNLVEAYNKIERFKEELQISAREAMDMLKYYRDKVNTLRAKRNTTKGIIFT